MSNIVADFDKIFNKNICVPSKVDSDELLNIIDYKGSIKSGLLFFNMRYGAIGVSDFSSPTPIKIINCFWGSTSLFNTRRRRFCSWWFSIDLNDYPDYTDKLDEESKIVVKEIENKLAELKDSGQILFLIPILKDLLNKQSEKLTLRVLVKWK